MTPPLGEQFRSGNLDRNRITGKVDQFVCELPNLGELRLSLLTECLLQLNSDINGGIQQQDGENSVTISAPTGFSQEVINLKIDGKTIVLKYYSHDRDFHAVLKYTGEADRPKHAALAAAAFYFLPHEMIKRALEAGEGTVFITDQQFEGHNDYLRGIQIDLRSGEEDGQLMVTETDITKTVAASVEKLHDQRKGPVLIITDLTKGFHKYLPQDLRLQQP